MLHNHFAIITLLMSLTLLEGYFPKEGVQKEK